MTRWLSFPFISNRLRQGLLRSEDLAVRVGPSNLEVRMMHTDDLPAVQQIERSSFPTPWSTRAFMSELTENLYAHYIVAVLGEQNVVGYAGMWIVLDEAHVTNIAVHPTSRGKRVGERLLREMIQKAADLGAKRMTLEVRRSNLVAQSLYRKLGFVNSGLRKGYYTDTKEDAIIMWLDSIGGQNQSQ